ncbi:type I glutamate--ammonia ligase [Nocardia zapadnayensis]|uniref:Glutamine synthetase n=1 Tax=Brevibacterium pityocampae TaxID=506594 RepID=A0ABP8JC77_9MICO|nr:MULTISPECIES: type I glutamate--ammonia ligase [Actinomycetes]MCK1804095.1 type I glutamate--ammonia ligase [Brevibacterium sp. R8603A2]MCX0277468.1 type I glutamate--ammonia ligase [Nocardia zapadnayensis]
MFSTSSELVSYLRDNDVQFVDIRFCDLPGVVQHFNLPASAYGEDEINDGLLFDGSSITGFQGIHESDMKLLADVSSAFIDPYRDAKTLVVNHSIVDPFTDEPYSRDPRQVAAKAEAYLKSTGIADTVNVGAEAEFYLFDSIQYQNDPGHGFFKIDSEEAAWNTGREELGGNLGYKTPYKGGYFPVSPSDHFADVRDAISLTLQELGFEVERAHHEVGTAGQQEINYKFDSLKKAGDQLLDFKYVVKNTAWEFGKSATFMPKPLFGDNGSGMHCHQSLWKDGEPLFYDENGYAGLSDLARWYIGGLIEHAGAVLAFTNPTINSYRRLVPGYEAPVNLVYSARNRSAAIRIPVTGSSPKAKRLEFRVPDPSCNPYLAFSAQLMAGLDGIKNRIEPPEPIDKDLYELPPEELGDIKLVPNSLDEALDELEADHDFLTAGDVFTDDLIETWIRIKREEEIEVARLRPTPTEFELYYSI